MHVFHLQNDETKPERFVKPQKGAIILSHELNNFTLQEAIDIYPEIMSVFKVTCFDMSTAVKFSDMHTARCPGWRGLEQDLPLC